MLSLQPCTYWPNVYNVAEGVELYSRGCSVYIRQEGGVKFGFTDDDAFTIDELSEIIELAKSIKEV